VSVELQAARRRQICYDERTFPRRWQTPRSVANPAQVFRSEKFKFQSAKPTNEGKVKLVYVWTTVWKRRQRQSAAFATLRESRASMQVDPMPLLRVRSQQRVRVCVRLNFLQRALRAADWKAARQRGHNIILAHMTILPRAPLTLLRLLSKLCFRWMHTFDLAA
jgi:hypothetical protein